LRQGSSLRGRSATLAAPWAACGSSAISYQLIVAPPSGTSIAKIADNAPRLRRSRARVATAAEPGATLRTSA
jgi:hypothetical protein